MSFECSDRGSGSPIWIWWVRGWGHSTNSRAGTPGAMGAGRRQVSSGSAGTRSGHAAPGTALSLLERPWDWAAEGQKDLDFGWFWIWRDGFASFSNSASMMSWWSLNDGIGSEVLRWSAIWGTGGTGIAGEEPTLYLYSGSAEWHGNRMNWARLWEVEASASSQRPNHSWSSQLCWWFFSAKKSSFRMFQAAS